MQQQNTQEVEIALIRLDGGTQSRVAISEDAVAEYAEAVADGTELPPVVLFHDGSTYWAADGFHRTLAHQRAGVEKINAIVLKGTRRDALLWAIGANAAHGLRRTTADKKRSVELLLADDEWGKFPVRQLARLAKVSWVLVEKVQAEKAAATGTKPDPVKTVTRPNGTTYQMDTSGITAARQKQAEHPPAREDAADVAVAADGHYAEGPPPGEPEAPGPSADPGPPGEDGMGIPVPPERAEVFAALDLFADLLFHLRKASKLVNEVARHPGGDYYRGELQALASHSTDDPDAVRFRDTDLWNAIKRAEQLRPFCVVCPYCHGKHPGRIDHKCGCCRGRGWVTEKAFEGLPKDYLAAVEALGKQPGEEGGA